MSLVASVPLGTKTTSLRNVFESSFRPDLLLLTGCGMVEDSTGVLISLVMCGGVSFSLGFLIFRFLAVEVFGMARTFL